MYIVCDKKGYASLATSYRTKDKTKIKYDYLGKVIDIDKGIFKNKERGYFTYNLETNEYGEVPEDFIPPKQNDKHKRILKCLEFGDSYLIDLLLWKSGFWELVDSIPWANKDTLTSYGL